MSSDNCSKFSKRLSSFMDGETSGREKEDIVRHLASCPACSEELQAMRAADEALGALPDIEPSPFFAARVAAAARAMNEYHGPFRRFLRLTVPAMGLALSLILVNVFSFAINLSAMEPAQRQVIVEKVVSCMRNPSTLVNPAALAKLSSDCGSYLCSCMEEASRCGMQAGTHCPICETDHTEDN